MINLKIGLDGIPNPSKLLLGNKYENEDEIIQFDLPEDFSTFNKYVIGVLNNKKTHTKRTIVLPVLNDQFIVSSQLTYFDGIWELYLMAREKTLDLSRTPVDITHDKDEHVFISNPIRGIINRSSIEREQVDNVPLDSNLKIVYDDLLSLIQEIIKTRDNGGFDGISPTVRIEEREGEREIIFTDRDGEHSTIIKDYDHNQEFQDLSSQVRADALASAESEKNAKQSESASFLSETKAKEQADLSKNFADSASSSAEASKLSESNTKKSEAEIQKIQTEINLSEENIKASEVNAKTSEANALSAETKSKETLEAINAIKANIDTQEQNVINLESIVAENKTIAVEKATLASTKADEAKSSAETSSQNAAKTEADKTEIQKLDSNITNNYKEIQKINTDINNTKTEIDTATNNLNTQVQNVENRLQNDEFTPNIQFGQVQTLAPNENVRITKRGTVKDPIFDIGIPKGEAGGIYYATFDVVNGELIMTAPDKYEGINFVLNENGELEAVLNEEN